MSQIDIFISHSSADAPVAQALIDLLRDAFNIDPKRIRCTSLPGYKLATGAHTETELRQEILNARVFIGLLSEVSLDSAYVLFELGARWGTGNAYGGYSGSSSKNRIFPLLAAGATASIVRDPLKAYNILNCENAGDMHQFIEEMGKELGQTPGSAAAYQKKMDTLIGASRQLKTKRTREKKAKEARAAKAWLEANPQTPPARKPAPTRVTKTTTKPPVAKARPRNRPPSN